MKTKKSWKQRCKQGSNLLLMPKPEEPIFHTCEWEDLPPNPELVPEKQLKYVQRVLKINELVKKSIQNGVGWEHLKTATDDRYWLWKDRM
jgi:hypothetical protein